MLFTEPLARTLGLEATLRGHRGCVNRLAWSQDGTLLASGSDDRQVLRSLTCTAVQHVPRWQQLRSAIQLRLLLLGHLCQLPFLLYTEIACVGCLW
jgi:hypothetical protein